MSLIHLAFTGDIICSKTHDKLCEKYNYAPIFEKVERILNDSDYLIGSLETTFSGSEANYTKTSQSFNTPDSFASCLKQVGFDMLTTASNHCLDRGVVGLKRTINILDEQGLDHTGTFCKRDEAKYLLKEIESLKFAFISCTYGTNSASNGFILSEDEEYHVNLTKKQDPYFVPNVKVKLFRFIKRLLPAFINKKLRPPKVVEDCVNELQISNPDNNRYIESITTAIEEAKAKADVVIVCLHSGGQYNLSTGRYTDFLFELFAKHGADVIIGNHTHSILPIRRIGSCVVFCSLGNFIYDPRELPSPADSQSEYSIIPRLGFDIEEKRMKSIEYSVCKTIINQSGIAVVCPVDDLNDSEEDVIKINNRLTGKSNKSKTNDNYFSFDLDC